MARPVNRIVLIVLDSLGCGADPDAAQYGDAGSNTLSHIARAVPGLALPNLAALGLGRIPGVSGIPAVRPSNGAFGRMQPRSAGKDTTTGHWELAGVVLEQPFPTYPHGFPAEVTARLEHAFARPILGNVPASGTEIIARLGDEHVRTGCPIVYTSADSVLQIAAHEAVIPLERLYAYCREARAIMQGLHGVGRIIARPFVGTSGQYKRTANRRDFSLTPAGPTLLDRAQAAGLDVIGVGKISDIFAGRGLTATWPTHSNDEGVSRTLDCLDEPFRGLLMVNLVDFDMLYGHRNDPAGYAAALMDFDRRLPQILARIGPEDRLCITADHGCDPTWPGSDHTREYVPLLIYGSGLTNIDLGTRSSFADLAATIADWLDLPPFAATSMKPLLENIKKA
jgi:phosphopentomutase